LSLAKCIDAPSDSIFTDERPWGPKGSPFSGGGVAERPPGEAAESGAGVSTAGECLPEAGLRMGKDEGDKGMSISVMDGGPEAALQVAAGPLHANG